MPALWLSRRQVSVSTSAGGAELSRPIAATTRSPSARSSSCASATVRAVSPSVGGCARSAASEAMRAPWKNGSGNSVTPPRAARSRHTVGPTMRADRPSRAAPGAG